MKEVQAKRLAGPYLHVPYNNYVQSPIGLVPKGQNKTRLIFHLLYDFGQYPSINHFTPEHLCTVKYQDLDYAVKICLKWAKP